MDTQEKPQAEEGKNAQEAAPKQQASGMQTSEKQRPVQQQNAQAAKQALGKQQGIPPLQQIEQQKLEAQCAEYKNDVQRLQAEFENFAKRAEKERAQYKEYAAADVFRELLAVLDSFDAAEKNLAAAPSVSRADAVKGIELLKKQLLAVLQAHGVQEMKTEGKTFDPEQQECMLRESNPLQADHSVLEEFQKGYVLKGKVLRTAKVKVNVHEHAAEKSGEGEKEKEGKNGKKENQEKGKK